MTSIAHTARMVSERANRLRLAPPDAYRTALTSRGLVRQALSATISHTGPLMATSLGLDNRKMLPPFCPVYRNEDGVFGQVLSQCFPHGYMTHLPFTLLHLPGRRSSYPNAQGSLHIRFGDILLACLSTWPGAPAGLSEAARMRSLGRHLIEIGSLAVDGFFDILMAPICDRAASTIRTYSSLLATYSPPHDHPWRTDLTKSINELELSIIKPRRLLPHDLFEHHSPGLVPEVTRDLVLAFGEVLYWWPTIVEKTRRLAVNGCTLAKKFGSI
jgi:hypothetical protein